MLDAGKLVKRMQEMRESGYLSDAIMREGVKTIAASEDKYHWVGIYLLDAQDNVLWLHNYVGEGTEHARIPVGEGVCGTAVSEGKNQNVPDVSKIENYLACSPRTKSEMVVLIRAGEEILGEIDLDSRQLNAFADTDELAVQMVADKIAEVLMAERR